MKDVKRGPYPTDIEQQPTLNGGECFEDGRYRLDVLL